MLARARPPALEHRADRERELRLRGGLRGAGLVAHQQVRRRPARASATTAAASSWTGRAARRRSAPWRSSRAPSTSTSSRTRARRPTWPPTSRARAGRPRPGHEPGPRRPPDARLAGQLLRQAVRDPAYGVREDDERIDYDALERQATRCGPKLIVAGASAYPRIIDFERIGAIAHERRRAAVGRHGAHRRPRRRGRPSRARSRTPTSSRRPRTRPCAGRAAALRSSATRRVDRQAVDKSVFPGIQGGPLMHVIAAKAVALQLADTRRVPRRPAAHRRERHTSSPTTLADDGAAVVSRRHGQPPDARRRDAARRDRARGRALLDDVGITVNKNAIPFDQLPPNIASGHPRRHAGDDDARLRAGRDARDRRADRATPSRARRRRRREQSRREVHEIVRRFPVRACRRREPGRSSTRLPGPRGAHRRRAASAFLADAAGHPLRRAARAIDDHPDDRRVHATPMARGGGVAVAIAFLIIGVAGLAAHAVLHFAPPSRAVREPRPGRPLRGRRPWRRHRRPRRPLRPPGALAVPRPDRAGAIAVGRDRHRVVANPFGAGKIPLPRPPRSASRSSGSSG